MEKMAPQMMSVTDALMRGYAELATIRSELDESRSRRGPQWRPDNTVATMYLWNIVKDLEKLSPPDIAALPSDIAEREICANICTGGKSRSLRRDNAVAKLRPAVAALRRAGCTDIAETVDRDISRIDSWCTPVAYQRYW
jgi:hypothetical protein